VFIFTFVTFRFRKLLNQRTENTALGFARTQCQCLKPSMVLQSVFNFHTFCGYASKAIGTLPVPLRYTAKEPSQSKA
jgi:hypothetical protein